MSINCLSALAITRLIPISWVLCEILNIYPIYWEAGPLVLGVASTVKIDACLEMKSPTWRSEDVSAAKVLGEFIKPVMLIAARMNAELV